MFLSYKNDYIFTNRSGIADNFLRKSAFENYAKITFFLLEGLHKTRSESQAQGLLA